MCRNSFVRNPFYQVSFDLFFIAFLFSFLSCSFCYNPTIERFSSSDFVSTVPVDSVLVVG